MSTEAVRLTSSTEDLTSTSSIEDVACESSTEVLRTTLLCEIEMLSSEEEDKSTDSNTSCGFIDAKTFFSKATSIEILD